jgi:hypothetical protein
MSEDTYVTVGNSTDNPLVVDEAGRFIEAHGFGTANVSRQPAKRLLEDGMLVLVEVPESDPTSGDEVNPAARRAARVTERRNDGDDAQTAYELATKDELDELATGTPAEELEGKGAKDDPATNTPADELAAQAETDTTDTATPARPARKRTASSQEG